MRVRSTLQLVVGLCVCLLCGATTASGEIVFLTSGRTLSVKGHRDDGPAIVLTLRNGGEVRCERSVVDHIAPDEVPHPDPTPAPAADAAPAGFDEQQPQLRSSPYADIIATLAAAHGVNPMLVRAMIQVESGNQPRARSARGAMGLMQLMPSTAKAYNVRNPFDPRANIDAGIRHLKTLIDRWGVELGLAAYNAGEGAVVRFNGIPPYRETRTYVSRILSLAGLK